MIFLNLSSFVSQANGKWMRHDLDRIHALLVDQECKVSILQRQPTYLIVSCVYIDSNL